MVTYCGSLKGGGWKHVWMSTYKNNTYIHTFTVAHFLLLSFHKPCDTVITSESVKRILLNRCKHTEAKHNM